MKLPKFLRAAAPLRMFALMLFTLFALCIIPIRVLIRRHPFRNYFLAVGFVWMRILGVFLGACGAETSLIITHDEHE